MKQTQNQFFGLKSEMPGRSAVGSTYLCEDSQELFLYGQDMKAVLVSGASSASEEVRNLALSGQSGYSHTGAFADKPLDNNYVWQAGAGIDYTQANVNAELWKVFSLSNAVHASVDNPYWSTPTPSGTAGVGLFQGANLPNDVTKLFEFDYDFGLL